MVYVDHDPDVITHAQKLLSRNPNVVAIEGDLRRPEQILRDPTVRTLINFDQPIGIFLVAVLHFVTDDENPYKIVDSLKRAMPPNSHLVLSHVTTDEIEPDAARQVQKLYERTTAPGVARNHAEVTRFFDGLDFVPPGLVNVASWQVDWMATEPGRTIFYAGVGQKQSGRASAR